MFPFKLVYSDFRRSLRCMDSSDPSCCCCCYVRPALCVFFWLCRMNHAARARKTLANFWSCRVFVRIDLVRSFVGSKKKVHAPACLHAPNAITISMYVCIDNTIIRCYSIIQLTKIMLFIHTTVGISQRVTRVRGASSINAWWKWMDRADKRKRDLLFCFAQPTLLSLPLFLV